MIRISRRRFCSIAAAALTVGPSGVSASTNEKYARILLESLEASSRVPFTGVYTYVQSTGYGDWEVWLNVSRRSAEQKKVEVLYPESLSCVKVIQTDGAFYMTPLREADRKRLSEAIKPIAWYRILKRGEVFEFEDPDLMLANYNVHKKGHETVAGRKVWKLAVRPRHSHRPSAELWIDKETKLQLKYIRFNPEGEPVERFEFNQIQTPVDLDASAFSRQGLDYVVDVDPEESTTPAIAIDFTPLQPDCLPNGFERKFSQSLKGRNGPVLHSLYTDGLASLSMYQRRMTDSEIAKAEQEPGADKDDSCKKVKKYSRKGRDIYFREFDGMRVSAVGDVDHCEIAKSLCCLHPAPELASRTEVDSSN